VGTRTPSPHGPLANVDELQPQSPTAVSDWQTSYQRQVEFHRWLQSAKGAIAGGATNRWCGDYSQPPAGTSTFYDIFYDEYPIYHDPPSNQWFGFEAWTMERMAELLYVNPDAMVAEVVERWVDWASSGGRSTLRPRA
jgi:hypothetical protein